MFELVINTSHGLVCFAIHKVCPLPIWYPIVYGFLLPFDSERNVMRVIAWMRNYGFPWRYSFIPVIVHCVFKIIFIFMLCPTQWILQNYERFRNLKSELRSVKSEVWSLKIPLAFRIFMIPIEYFSTLGSIRSSE
jgi:hypothetical protein